MSAVKIILASSSPRRNDLMQEAGYQFTVDPSDADEENIPHFTPSELVLFHARNKAQQVAKRHPDALVIGADTLVCLGNQLFGKPADMTEAKMMLGKLSGHSHHVVTGVWFTLHSRQYSNGFIGDSLVTFKPLDATAIDAYFCKVNPLDKAGAYAAQEEGRDIIASLHGSLTNVIGLPMERLREELGNLNIFPSKN